MKDITVTFLPQRNTITVAPGTDLLSACARAGIGIHASCGGEGLCGKCKVIVKKGKVKAEPTELVSAAERAQGMVLACEAIIESDLEVLVPQESFELPLESHETEAYIQGIVAQREQKLTYDPLVHKFYLTLPKPTLDDNTSDLDRIYRELEGKCDGTFVMTRLANIKQLGDVIRDSDFKVTATIGVCEEALEILAIEPGDVSKKSFGCAFDIGTTTVAGQLIDLTTKEILGTRIAYNRQARFGSDVITRIVYGSEPDGLATLNKVILDNINEMITELTAAEKLLPNDIAAVVCAGNTTMMHFLLKIDPTHIRREPYISTATALPPVHAAETGIRIHPKGVAYFLPGVSTYLGGDIVSGVLASGLFEKDALSLLVDIGTNGEIVLGNREWMIGAAASAGPAFEGSGLACGMKAVAGAIQGVAIGNDLSVKLTVIGNQKPKGICGSGYIDLLREMRVQGIIGKDGKINGDKKSSRIRKGETSYEFVVASAQETAIGKDIIIQEEDIENLKRAKGAIYSAIQALLNKVEKKAPEIKHIYIAGGFGNYLNIENAIHLGLLPDTDRTVYEFIGNSSLVGARMSLLSRPAYAQTKTIARSITYVDLSSEPQYMDEYVASLFFPHTDSGRFPSVRS